MNLEDLLKGFVEVNNIKDLKWLGIRSKIELAIETLIQNTCY